MTKPLISLKNRDLEEKFLSLFNKMDIEAFGSTGQVDLNMLDSNKPTGHHLEIDIILLINNTCVFVSVTGEKGDNKKNIKKFIRHCNLFIISKESLHKKFSYFKSIPIEKLTDFEEITNYKFVHFGTSEELSKSRLTAADFPDYPDIQKNLKIFYREDIQYLEELVSAIGHYAKYEFYASIGFTANELGEERRYLEPKCLEFPNKYITKDKSIKANIYLTSFKPEELLKIGRVSRYQGLSLAPQGEDGKYQRLFIKSKLNLIAKEFIKDNVRTTFPTTVTLVLSERCQTKDKTGDYLTDEDGQRIIRIPLIYGSVDIIDGQHRIFAYANRNIRSKDVLEESDILATAIEFNSDNREKITRFAAKTFCEINSEQAKVQKNLLYLLKYDVLKERDHTSIAAKIIIDLDKERGVLQNMFLTNPLIRDKKLPIVTIVNTLSPIFKRDSYKSEYSKNNFMNLFGVSTDKIEEDLESILTIGKKNLKIYFKFISDTFREDWWERREDSNLISANYFSAFIRLLNNRLFFGGGWLDSKGKWEENCKDELKEIKTKVRKKIGCGKTETTFFTTLLVPQKKIGVNAIYDFLNDPENWYIKED